MKQRLCVRKAFHVGVGGILFLALVGVALAPSLASAINLVTCTPTAGSPIVAKLRPGLTCDDAKNTVSVSVTAKTGLQYDNCAANNAAPWDAWVTGKVGKLAAADAATIAKAETVFMGTVFGSCNLLGDANSLKVAGTGTVTFFDGAGTKVKNGKVTFFGRAGADLATQSEQIIGIVTKGFGVGGTIVSQVDLDPAAPDNFLILLCNIGTICDGPPADDVFLPKGNASCTGNGAPKPCCTGKGTGSCFPPVTKFDLITGAQTKLSIDLTNDLECTAAGTPYYCCTGAGTGRCN